MGYVAVFAGLFVAASACVAAGLSDVGMLLYPAPVAYYWAIGLPGRSLGLVGGAALAVLMTTGAWAGAAVFAIAAYAGVPMGVAIARQWRFGAALAVTAAAASALVSAGIAMHWKEARRLAGVWIAARAAQIEETARETGQAAPAEFVEVLRWFEAHFADFVFGVNFGWVLAGAAIGLAVVNRWARAHGAGAGLQGSFAAMRPPDALVWLAIALALMWFAERRWPHELLRAVTWNGAIALAFVYAMNGFGIVVYALRAFRAGPGVAWFVLLAILVFLFNSLPALAAGGFFDTWWNLRERCDRLAALRGGGGSAAA